MKTFFYCFLILIGVISLCNAVTTSQYSGDLLVMDGRGYQGCSHDGTKTSIVGTSATFHDLSESGCASFYCSGACYMRLTPTAANGAYPQVTIPSSTWVTVIKNVATPFVNISTANGAAHQWMQQ
jgi:hypothetical protein